MKVNIDKDELYSLYVEQKLSLSAIAKQYGVSAQSILNYLKKQEIPRRGYSESLKGRKFTESWREKIRQSNLSRPPMTEDQKEKISKSCQGRVPINKGKNHIDNPEIVKQAGEEHWNWQGGITKEQLKIRNSVEYKKWIKAVFKRDKYTCQHCNTVGGTLHAHHIKQFKHIYKEKELLYNVENGLTLCISCHFAFHKTHGK